MVNRVLYLLKRGKGFFFVSSFFLEMQFHYFKGI